ncbi:MAG TPA: hypothetical protein VFW88_05115 [Burkholderiales bacterium]|nr:hypothetical protein [Burkholderiales bacterium]
MPHARRRVELIIDYSVYCQSAGFHFMFDPRVALAVILTLFVSVLQAGTTPRAAAPVSTPQSRQGIYPPQRSAVRPARHPHRHHAAKRSPSSKNPAAKQYTAAR